MFDEVFSIKISYVLDYIFTDETYDIKKLIRKDFITQNQNP